MIYTIGHSTRELGAFLGLLAAHRVTQVVDVRRYPASRRHPQFARDALATALEKTGIRYHHEPDLGGRRAARRDSANTAWRAGFRGYADYMETAEFEDALARLRELARARPTASWPAALRRWALSSDRPTLVGGGITRPFGAGPPWTIAVAGLVAVAGLGYVDFATGPELTPLLFYLAPVVLVAWYAGRGPGLGVACAGAIAWLLSDALTHGDYRHWSIPYWNGAVRLAALVLGAEIVARLRAAAARERDQARADPRTGVANLRAFYELADAEIARARRYPHAFSVAYIDLDEFKLVNFRLGHGAGDAVLRSVARALTGVLRASDTVARIGGDQFVVLLPEAGAAAARLTVEKLRRALADVVPAHGWRITASIGVATFLVPPESVDALLAAADRLMYQAKQSGKNTVAHETQNEAPVLR